MTGTGLTGRIVLAYAALFVLLEAATIFAVHVRLASELHAGIIHDGDALATTLAENVADALFREDPVAVLRLLDGARRSEPSVRYAFVTDRGGRPVAHTFGAGVPEDLLRVDAPAAPSRRTRPLRSEEGLIYDVSTPLAGRLGTLRIGLSTTRIDAALASTERTICLFVTLILVAGGAASIAIARGLTRPIRELCRVAARVREGDLETHADERGPADYTALARAWNGVTRTLAGRIAEQRAILQGIDAAILHVDRDHRIVWHNAVAERWFGLESGVRPPCHVAAFGRDSPCTGCPSASCFATGLGRAGEFVCDGPRGVRHYHVTGSPVRGNDGEVTGVVELIQDVTERRALEAQLRESESLARVGELAATIAHEIKNPLAGIRSAVELAARDLPKGSCGEQAIPRVIALIERLDVSVRDLLTFVRPSPRRVAPCDLREVVDDALGVLRADPAVARVAVRCEGADRPAPVHADAAALRQVVANLVLNAAEAMEALPPEEAELRIAFRRTDDGLALEVADRGPGVSAEVRTNLFKPFFTTKATGTGLGLAICRRIVESHGGSIAVESAPGQGATVRVTIPEEARA